ncbi:MAG: hypothetical protein OHK0017_10070 [Patescibacteria group bacterium]
MGILESGGLKREKLKDQVELFESAEFADFLNSFQPDWFGYKGRTGTELIDVLNLIDTGLTFQSTALNPEEERFISFKELFDWLVNGTSSESKVAQEIINKYSLSDHVCWMGLSNFIKFKYVRFLSRKNEQKRVLSDENKLSKDQVLNQIIQQFLDKNTAPAWEEVQLRLLQNYYQKPRIANFKAIVQEMRSANWSNLESLLGYHFETNYSNPLFKACLIQHLYSEIKLKNHPDPNYNMVHIGPGRSFEEFLRKTKLFSLVKDNYRICDVEPGVYTDLPDVNFVHGGFPNLPFEENSIDFLLSHENIDVLIPGVFIMKEKFNYDGFTFSELIYVKDSSNNIRLEFQSIQDSSKVIFLTKYLKFLENRYRNISTKGVFMFPYGQYMAWKNILKCLKPGGRALIMDYAFDGVEQSSSLSSKKLTIRTPSEENLRVYPKPFPGESLPNSSIIKSIHNLFKKHTGQEFEFLDYRDLSIISQFGGDFDLTSNLDLDVLDFAIQEIRSEGMRLSFQVQPISEYLKSELASSKVRAHNFYPSLVRNTQEIFKVIHIIKQA